MREWRLFTILQRLTAKKLFNSAKILSSYSVSMILRKPVLWGLPFVMTVEPTNLCNLHCPQCDTGKRQRGKAAGKMSFETFRRIVDELGDCVFYLLLYFQGEPYLNDLLLDFVRYAKSKGIYTTTNTNGHFLIDNNNAERTVTSGLDSILISLDGADEETYLKYRRGGDFHRVLRGIELLVEKKKHMRSKTPLIYLQFLVMKHNEKQIEKMRKLASDLQVDKLLLKTLQVEDAAAGRQFLPTEERYRRYRIDDGQLMLKAKLKNSCQRLWTSSLITWEGAVSPCCFDKEGKYAFGKISERETFTSLWRGKRYQDFRGRILADRKSIPICINCTEGFKIYV